MAARKEAQFGPHHHQWEQKHATEPMQFGKTFPLFSSLGHCLCLRYCRKTLGRTIRKVQGFSL